MSRAALAFTLCLLTACAGLPDKDAGPAELIDESAEGVDTQALGEALRAALEEAPDGVEGMSLLVHGPDDARLIDLTAGDFDPDEPVAVASASKLITALVLLRLVHEGSLSLEETTGARLGWSGEAAEITLDQLGAFTSGLPGRVFCTWRLRVTLAECVDSISEEALVAAPGTRYDYGSTHMAVAGGMAEAATGELWASLFERTLAEPLGVSDPELRYVTRPSSGRGEDNPMLAGGLIASAEQYMPMLALLFHQGQHNGEAWIAPELVARMGENHYPDVTLGEVPDAIGDHDYRYSFGAWLECEGPVERCALISSPGAFGFTPWVDLDRGYYAVLAMRADGVDGAPYSVPLVESLRPLIHEALGL